MNPSTDPSPSTPIRRIVITGGPGSGKTTLVQALAELGFVTVSEAAIEVIGELIEQHGNEGQRAWRAANGSEFQARILARQIQCEESLPVDAGHVFLDRGRHDGLAYCRHRADEPPSDLLAALEGWHYEAVFLLATLSSFEERRSTGRTSTRADSVAIGGAIAAVYEEYGMTPIVVPEASIEARVEFVTERLRLG